MNPNLLDEFRERLNRYNFCARKYRDFEGENKWNRLCSATDWLSVAVDSIDFDPAHNLIGYDFSSSMKALSLIMRVDLIDDCINQLHQVLFNTTHIYLEDDTSVFNEHPFGKPDRKQFKIVRACFGVHPVDIDRINRKTKYFASWSFGGLSGFVVILYPSIPNADDIVVSIDFNQIKLYANKRYNHLTDLIIEIDRQYNEHLEIWRSKPISRSINPSEWLATLIKEQEQRFDNDHYNLILQRMSALFDSTILPSYENRPLPEDPAPIEKLIFDWMTSMLPLIDELHDVLQNMDVRKIELEQRFDEIWKEASVHLIYDE